MCINDLTISPQGSFRQAKTDSHLNKKDIVRKKVNLFDTKIGKTFYQFFRKALPRSKYTNADIRFLVALIIIDDRSKDPKSSYHNMRKLCKDRANERFRINREVYNLLAVPVKYFSAVTGFCDRTTKRSIRKYRADDFVLILRKFTGEETSSFSTNHYAPNYHLIIQEVIEGLSRLQIPVDNSCISTNCGVSSSNSGVDVDDILRYFSDDQISCLRILSSNEIVQSQLIAHKIREIKEHKKCPLITYDSLNSYNYSSKDPKSFVNFIEKLRKVRCTTMRIVQSSNEVGSFLTKKAFTAVVNGLGLSETAKDLSFSFKNGNFVVDLPPNSKEEFVDHVFKLIDRVWKRLLPHLYRISHWLGWFGRVKLVVGS